MHPYTDEKDERFDALFRKMIDCMTVPENFSREELVACLTELAEMFQLSKTETEFYQSEAKEKRRDGEYLCDFDTGEPGALILTRRIVTRTGAVIKTMFYRPDGKPPLSAYDFERLDLCMRCVLSFVSRNRLTNAVEALGFYDERGFGNIRAYVRFIEQVQHRGQLAGEYTAMLCNLRHFGLINQDVGRENADIIMHIFYNRLSVIAGEDGIVCRMGGDNFLALFRNALTDSVIEYVRGAPVCYDRAENKRLMVTATAGLYPLPADFVFRTPGDIMDKLLAVSQAAKYSEEDTVLFYDQKILEQKRRIRRIQQVFPEALRAREFRVYYQPKVDVETGELVGAEALCRWFRDGVMIPPADFIPVLEQTKDICNLDFYMLEQVCADIQRWLGENRKPVRVSVNFSRKHLSDIDLLGHIMQIIDACGIPHHFVEIELTETTTDVEFRDLKQLAAGLQRHGVFISVDDFGMGYSSLNLIREVQWNVLKIDRCFLPGDGESENSTTGTMFRHVVAMALDLGMECLTEGVETAKQVELLRKHHCGIAQGYFFNKPLPTEQFEALLDGHRYPIVPAP